MRKMLSEFANSVRKVISKVAHWVGTAAAWTWDKVIHPPIRFTLKAVGWVFVGVGTGLVVTLYMAASVVVWSIDVVSTLLSKALALVTIAICLPFLFLFGWSVTKNALQTGLNILTHWSADTIHAGTMILEERRAAKETVEVVVESVPASQVKGRPTPKQRKRRPARPAGGFAPVAV